MFYIRKEMFLFEKENFENILKTDMNFKKHFEVKLVDIITGLLSVPLDFRGFHPIRVPSH